MVVEERYSAIFNLDRIRPAVVADGLAELQVRWPAVPIVFCDNRRLAEEWTYRYLAAARTWAAAEGAALERIGLAAAPVPLTPAPVGEPTTAEIRSWARGAGLAVADRGRLRPEVLAAYHAAHPSPDGT